MSAAKHSAGPWSCCAKLTASENHSGFYIHNGIGWRMAEVHPGDQDGRLGEADARLIVASPDLLDACRALIAYDECDSDGPMPSVEMMVAYENAVSRARAAIRKATGDKQ